MDTKVGTKQAAAWAAKAYDLYLKGLPLPKTWEYLGAGWARAALRHKPTGVVYKVVKFPGRNDQALTEDTTAKELRKLNVPWILPSTLYQFKTPDHPLVTAMPFAPPDTEKARELFRSPLFDTISALVSDMHEQNVGFDPETGQPYVIDVGISYGSAEEFQRMDTRPSQEVLRKRREKELAERRQWREDHSKNQAKFDAIRRTSKYERLNHAGKFCLIDMPDCACKDAAKQVEIFERES